MRGSLKCCNSKRRAAFHPEPKQWGLERKKRERLMNVSRSSYFIFSRLMPLLLDR